MDYEEAQKYGGKAVEASNDGETWVAGILKGVEMRRCDMDLWRAGKIVMHPPITTYTVDVLGAGEIEFKEIRPLRKFKKGDMVTGEGSVFTVDGYTKGGMLKIVDENGTEWTCSQDAVELKPNFDGVSDYIVCTAGEDIAPGSLITIDGAGMGFVLRNDVAAKFKTVFNHKLTDEETEQVYRKCCERKFKAGQYVKAKADDEMLGVVTGYDDDDVLVLLKYVGGLMVVLDEECLELWEKPEVRVDASTGMTDCEKLEKVVEFAEELGLTVDEINGDVVVVSV